MHYLVQIQHCINQVLAGTFKPSDDESCDDDSEKYDKQPGNNLDFSAYQETVFVYEEGRDGWTPQYDPLSSWFILKMAGLSLDDTEL